MGALIASVLLSARNFFGPDITPVGDDIADESIPAFEEVIETGFADTQGPSHGLDL